MKKRDIHIKRMFHDVESSNLRRVYWSLKYTTLVVEFHDGAVYMYPDVPLRYYQRLMKAPSKGKYLHHVIVSAYQGYRIELETKEVGKQELMAQLEESIRTIHEKRNKAS